MGTKKDSTIYDVAIYCRLSKEDLKEDGDRDESASIGTQKAILTDYVRQRGWHLVQTYVDDGYSGTNFQRPGFQSMIQDIEAKRINCVITKDLSRLGRNYLDCGLYLEVFFPEHGVRYISVNDGVDTLNKSAMDITPFRNILNEMYAADVSMKVKSALRARFNSGLYVSTSPPYGYLKDPADHNHLIIDEKAAPVVKLIFQMALDGAGIGKIRNHLNASHILRPAAYAAAERGESGYERHFEGKEDNRYQWSNNSVRAILRSPVYAGNLVGYKRVAVSMKSKKRPSKLPEEWEVIPNTHEGIVTQAQFDTVQRLMTSRRRDKGGSGFDNIFSGILKCADCGYAMRAMSANRRKRPDPIDCVQYVCNNYGTNGAKGCSAHTIEARDLFDAVLADIRHYARLAVEGDEKRVRQLQQQLSSIGATEQKALEREKRKLSKRLGELDKLFSALYEDKVMERITERNFDMVSRKYEAEQAQLSGRIEEINASLAEKETSDNGVTDFFSLIAGYADAAELSAAMVNALIEKITVGERVQKEDGTVEQTIKIYYKFVGVLSNELHIKVTKRYAAPLSPRRCQCCGAEFTPGSAVAKYCKPCAKKIHIQQCSESTRHRRAAARKAA